MTLPNNTEAGKRVNATGSLLLVKRGTKFGQYISTKDDLFVRNTALLITYWQTVLVYASSIRYAIVLQRATQLFQEAQATYITAICLIERAADNMINFQAIVKKRRFASFDELLKYCRQFSFFQQLSKAGLTTTDCFERILVPYYSTDHLCCRFSTNGYHGPYVARLFCYLWREQLSQDTSRAQAVERS